jgi:hypothetical protein
MRRASELRQKIFETLQERSTCVRDLPSAIAFATRQWASPPVTLTLTALLGDRRACRELTGVNLSEKFAGPSCPWKRKC